MEINTFELSWVEAGVQQVVIVAVPSLNSLGIDSRNDMAIQTDIKFTKMVLRW